MINRFEFNPIEKINFSTRKDPSPITLFLSKQKENIKKLAVIELLKLINIKNVKLSDIKLVQLDSGKPKVQLKNGLFDEEIYVSFSHKDDLHLVAAALKPIGVDIEKKRNFSLGLVKKTFTEAEIQSFGKIFEFINNDNIKKKMDFAYTSGFSLKESASKVIGRGLSIDFRKILINFKEDKIKINILGSNCEFLGYITQKYGYIISLIEQIN